MVEVTVEDGKTCICKGDQIVSFMENGSEGWASDFNNKSEDNCTEEENLEFRIRVHDPSVSNPSVPTDQVLHFDCLAFDNLQLIPSLYLIWVGDESGNWNFCITNLELQDNMNTCADPSSVAGGNVAGLILTEDGDEVDQVLVSLVNEDPTYSKESLSDNGSYHIDNVTVGTKYMVSASKDGDYNQGVSTLMY